MTTLQLKQKVSFFFSGYGHKKVTIIYRGKEYSCTSTNTIATDRINSDDAERKTPKGFYTTLKQAYLSLWNECKRANDLK